jgi:hypothetical protein
MLAHCPLCQAAYGDDAVQFLGDLGSRPGRGSSRMFHLTCAKCSHALLAVVVESPHGVSSIGLVTDLEASDAARVYALAPVSADDVVRAHMELDTRSADLCRDLMNALK